MRLPSPILAIEGIINVDDDTMNERPRTAADFIIEVFNDSDDMAKVNLCFMETILFLNIIVLNDDTYDHIKTIKITEKDDHIINNISIYLFINR